MDWLVAGIVFVIALVIYLYTVSPTVAFWDVGEFLACSHILGVPHPPGTPLFVLVGRIFSLLPIFPEIAMRINFMSVLSGTLTAALASLLISRVIRSFKIVKTESMEKWIPTVAGVAGALFILFAFSVWDNSLEAEVYSPSTLIGFGIIYLTVLWRDRFEAHKAVGAVAGGTGSPLASPVASFKNDALNANSLVLLALYITVLSSGIHLTPLLMLFGLIPFIAIVNHRLLPAFFLGILGLSFMLFELGWPQIAVLSLFVGYIFTQSKMSRKGFTPAWLFLGSYLLLILLAALKLPLLVILLGVAVFVGVFLYAAKEYKLDMKFLAIGAVLVAIGYSVQLYLLIRAHQHPSINMVAPETWDRFFSVLRREQYGRATVQNQLWPRKTVVDPDTGQATGIGPIAGILWQFVMYIKYYLWQWGMQALSGKSALTVAGRVLLTAVPTALGIMGLYSLAKRDKKLFWLLLTGYLLASVGLVIYVNMRFPHSGPLPKGFTSLPQEVRERDYFFTFSYAIWGLFTGFGLFEIIASLKQSVKRKGLFRVLSGVTGGVTIGAAVLAGIVNLPFLSRHGDWIPLEYGYNILASCREPSVIFTNGDNDTFPLWFVQEVPSTSYENNKKPYKHGVINANLSLLNTPWYIEQLKRKGAPVSFVYESKNEKIPLVKTSAGNAWEGYAAHPPVKPKTFEFTFFGRKVKADRHGNLYDSSRRKVGSVDTLTGLVSLAMEPEKKENGIGYIVADYGSGEIDNLPAYVILGRNRVIMLADLMIRDMLATNAGKVYADSEKVSVSGFSTKIPRDYLLPAPMFIDNVMKDYKETVMPVYFSSTVSPSRVSEFGPYLIQEGLALRFRKAPPSDTALTRPAINIDRSVQIFTKEFKMKSILDPKVRRDEQAKGLFINYGVAMQEIGELLASRGEPKKAYEFVKPVAQFEVEPEVRRVFLLNLYMFASQAGATEDADKYRKELEANNWLGGDFYIRQGIGYLRRGDTVRAEQELKKAYASATRENYQPLVSLALFYLETTKDTAKAMELTDAWNRRYPGHEVAFRLYLDYLNAPAKAIGVLDELIRMNPTEPGLIQFRDSLKRAFNL